MADKSEDTDDSNKHVPKGHVSIYEPMFIWVLLLVIAVVAKVLLSSPSLLPSGTEIYAAANLFSNFILQIPGLVILPLIIGAIIGAEVGARSSTSKNAMRSGVLNGVYASVIYTITIIIIYVIIGYSTPQVIPIYTIILNSIVLPIVVLLITIEVFSILSFSRKVDT